MEKNEILKIIAMLAGAGYEVIAVKQTPGSGLIAVKAFPPDKDNRK